MSTYLNISDKIGLQSTPNPLLLNFYGGAAAAYSLRQLDYNYTGSAITVRRSSDNTTKDIGFINGELDTASLESFTNEDYVRLTSDFSGANPSPNPAPNDLTVTSNQSALGVNEALKCTVTGSNPYFYTTGFGGAGIDLRISFDYYIPSGQTLNSIRVGVASTEQVFNTTGEWVTVTFEQISSYVFIIFRGNGSSDINDEFYIKNINITQLTSDAFVTAWYDQSGNGVNATQTSDAYQPKIVSLGSTILDNSKPTIQFDGVDDGFTTLIPGSSVFDFYAVTNANLNDDYILPDNYAASGSYYGYISRSDSDTFIYQNYGSPSLYVNSNLENPVTRSNVKQLIATGSELIQVHQGADTSLWNNIELFKRSSFAFAGTAKEVIIYDTDQSANRANIESNINSYYSIY